MEENIQQLELKQQEILSNHNLETFKKMKANFLMESIHYLKNYDKILFERINLIKNTYQRSKDRRKILLRQLVTRINNQIIKDRFNSILDKKLKLNIDSMITYKEIKSEYKMNKSFKHENKEDVTKLLSELKNKLSEDNIKHLENYILLLRLEKINIELDEKINTLSE